MKLSKPGQAQFPCFRWALQSWAERCTAWLLLFILLLKAHHYLLLLFFLFFNLAQDTARVTLVALDVFVLLRLKFGLETERISYFWHWDRSHFRLVSRVPVHELGGRVDFGLIAELRVVVFLGFCLLLLYHRLLLFAHAVIFVPFIVLRHAPIVGVYGQLEGARSSILFFFAFFSPFFLMGSSCLSQKSLRLEGLAEEFCVKVRFWISYLMISSWTRFLNVEVSLTGCCWCSHCVWRPV